MIMRSLAVLTILGMTGLIGLQLAPQATAQQPPSHRSAAEPILLAQRFNPGQLLPRNRDRSSADGAPTGSWLQQLDLSREQLRQLNTIRLQRQPQISTQRQELQRQRQRLRELLISDAPSQEVAAQHQRVQQLSQEVERLQFQSILEAREILTLEQRRRMADLLEQRFQNVQSDPSR